MARILEPALRRVVNSGTLVATTLTPVDVGFSFGSLEGALILGIDGAFDPSTITNADDRSMSLIARPDVAVISAIEPEESWGDPDFLSGWGYRTSFATEGGFLELLTFEQKLIEPWLIHRDMTAMFFDDNAVTHTMGIWYKNVLLNETDLVGLLAGRR